jgi:hypothetical protein
MTGQGKTKIHHHWKQRDGSARWRIWDKLNPKNRARTKTITKEVKEELGKRKIRVSEEEDQLRWGNKNGGEFNFKISTVLHRESGPRKSGETMGKKLENPPIAKHQNVQMACST